MPDFEFEFNQQDAELIINQDSGTFGGIDYIRLTIYPTEAINNIVQLSDNTKGINGQAIFFSTLNNNFSIDISPFGVDEPKLLGGIHNDFKIYQNDDDIYIKPNDIFDDFQLPQGNYKIQIDFLNQQLGVGLEAAPTTTFYNPTATLADNQNTNTDPEYLATLPFPRYREEFDIVLGNSTLNFYDAEEWAQPLVGRPDISNYLFNLLSSAENPTGDYYIYPNYVYGWSTFSDIINVPTVDPYSFIVRQISNTRKEVRLKLKDNNLVENSIIKQTLINELNDNEPEFLEDEVIESETYGQFVIPNSKYKYQFKHILNIGNGNHISIMNYTFDKITDGKNNQSIILKLYEPLPISVNNLDAVTIEREVLTTQTQDVFYFSDVPDVFFGNGLQPDPQENWINPDGNNLGFQSLDELAISASIGDIEINSLISSSDNYPNINTDFNEFVNHTFFGSAEQKLINFKSKVETIQEYYSEISSSLSVSSSIKGDSDFIITKRKNLFNKINQEINSFTPYELFLYYDGQGETTASAPGLGKNYADTIPVQLAGNSVEGIELNQHNGFNVVYKHSSEKVSGTHNKYIDLFTDKYFVQNKPFFNYSSSIYLSFLMQGDSGSAINYQNSNNETFNGLVDTPLPQDTKYQNNILNPDIGDVSSSIYKRYIFEASMSYFAPFTSATFPSTNDIVNFRAGSLDVEILNGKKTGSLGPIKAYGEYSNLATQQVQPGVPFTGSIMPAGELFRIYHQNSLSSSLQGYWNIDDVTSGSSLSINDVANDAGPTTGDATTVSQVTASSGVEVHGRQYGSSYFMVSESQDTNTGVHFDTTDFNFSKDDNFSLSIWAKRFHPNTPSADAGGAGNKKQSIFTRGLINDMYGIDYDCNNNKIRAGVRPGADATIQNVEMEMGDDLLNWHHLVMTYESGSDTGIKLYIDGVLTGSVTSVTDGDGDTMGDFSSSAVTTTAEKLTIGGDDTFQASATIYNGFLQYPRVYDRVITPSEVNQLYLKPDGNTETKITDVKISLNNPTNVLPFDNIYKTTSTEWVDWYNNAISEAQTFDTNNIHSFENNLPLYIKESSEYNEMKTFLNLQGEQYDLIRNHIDSMGTIHKRGYKKTNSPPDNTLPMLLSNMGWQAINPFEGDLTETLGSYLSGITSIDDIKNNTWRKTLNNLLYIYKSKGTKNSVRGLLNTYGYPPDVLQIQEFGGSIDADVDDPGFIISDDEPIPQTGDNFRYDTDLKNQSFTSNKNNFSYYNFNADTSRVLNLDWWMDDANINTIEFVYKHNKSTNTQTILKSSGSGTENLWDLRLIPSSDGLSSSFEFRLNNSKTGSLAIASNGVSMSTNYSNMLDGQLWNVMLQRMTGSTSTNITNEYRLHTAFQNNKTIETYNYVTMSVSGAAATDSNNIANQNFMGTGSRNELLSSNLFVGEVFSGSLSQIKGWSTALSTSKFRQHTLNKFSTVGNTISSHCKELIYNFKLNENYASSSISSSVQNLTIVDAGSENYFKNYSFEKPGQIFQTSSIYGSELIDIIRFTLQDNNSDKQNNNNILVNPKKEVISDLNPNKPSVESLTNSFGKKPKIKVSNKLELYRSPQNFVDNFILDNISSFNLESLYGNPLFYYSSSYDEFDTFRKEFFDCYEIKIDVNKFIRAHENMFNHSLVEGLKSVVPASSTLSGKNSNIGVEIKPTILEKPKYENKKATLVINPNTFTSSVNPSPSVLPTIEFEKSGSVSVLPTYSGSSLLLPKSGSVSVIPTYSGSSVVFAKSGSISLLPTYDGSTVVLPTSGTSNFISTHHNKSFENIHSNWGTGADDTYFVSYASGISGSDAEYNIRHIEPRFVFHMIGDTEFYSGSSQDGTDYTNQSLFFNRVMLTEGIHANITYDSFISGDPGTQTGRMIGKTKYFFTGSDGEIILPANHVSRYDAGNHWLQRMKKGTQNTDPGILNVQAEDYSTSSFYGVEVTPGEREIIVKGNTLPNIDSKNRSQY